MYFLHPLGGITLYFMASHKSLIIYIAFVIYSVWQFYMYIAPMLRIHYNNTFVVYWKRNEEELIYLY